MLIENAITTIKEKTPLVHCITNYVTVNECANALLAIGGSPIMADEPKEMQDIAGLCDALVLNIGTINQRTASSMLIAGKRANERGVPVILDPVGNGASAFRTQTIHRLLQELRVDIIKGNRSEIKMLAYGHSAARGVDAGAGDAQPLEQEMTMVKDLAKKLGLVVGMSGAVDVVSDGELVYTIANGTPMLEKITGAGCLLSCVMGAFVGALEDRLAASAMAMATLALAGERAEHPGAGSFRTGLIDQLSGMNDQRLREGARIETH